MLALRLRRQQGLGCSPQQHGIPANQEAMDLVQGDILPSQPAILAIPITNTMEKVDAVKMVTKYTAVKEKTDGWMVFATFRLN